MIAYFSVKKKCILTKLSVMYAKHAAPLVSIFLTEFQVLLVVKLSKIGENPENSRKIFVFEANKTAKAKIFSEIFMSLERKFNCAKISSNMDGLG